MITKDQIYSLTKKHKTNETVVFREYLQLLLLSKLYSQKESKNIFFKGGTALHLIYRAPRFSEDLDFDVEMEEKDFLDFIHKVFEYLSKNEPIKFRERKSIVGKKFLLTASPSILSYKTFVSMDFSFREKVLEPEKSIIETDFPVLFTAYVHHLSKGEIFVEKIRAILTRKKGRDLYDLWYLLTQGEQFKKDLVIEKLKYYNLLNVDNDKILEEIEKFSEKEFVLDLRPFVPVNERDELPNFFQYIKNYLKKELLT